MLNTSRDVLDISHSRITVSSIMACYRGPLTSFLHTSEKLLFSLIENRIATISVQTFSSEDRVPSQKNTGYVGG